MRAAANLRKRFLVEPGTRLRLARIDPADTAGIEIKHPAEETLSRNIARLQKLPSGPTQHT